MKQKILDFLASKDSGKFHSINKLLFAIRNPKTREQFQEIKKEISSLADDGLIEVSENRHKLLDQIDSTTYADANGNALPRRYLDLTDLAIEVRGKGSLVVTPYKAVPTPSPHLPPAEPTFVAGEVGAKRADYEPAESEAAEEPVQEIREGYTGQIRGKAEIEQPTNGVLKEVE